MRMTVCCDPGKMKRLLVLLLIILKETGATTACSSTSCSSTYCNCAAQGLNSVPQLLPTNMDYIILYGNEITALWQYDFLRYWHLLALDLGYNQISSIDSEAFYNMTILYDLRLHGNQLTSLRVNMFEGLDNLEVLHLYNNDISSIEIGTFSSTPKLATLVLRQNSISAIAAGTLSNLSRFRSLDLSNNRINNFPVDLLANLSTLSHLDMENNQMETLLPEAYEIMTSVSTTNLGSNPWQCDCRMLPFRQRMTGYYFFEYSITCAGPGSFQGKSLLYDIFPEDLTCEPTTSSAHTNVTSLPYSMCGPDSLELKVLFLPVFLSAFLGVLAATLFVCAIFFAIRCTKKIRTRNTSSSTHVDPSAGEPSVVFTNTNTTATATIDIGGHGQTGQDNRVVGSNIVTGEYEDISRQSGSGSGHRQQALHSGQGYEEMAPSLPPRNAAGPQVVYQNGSDSEGAHSADAPHYYQPLRRNFRQCETAH
ncbi:uncharacterized protein LOC144886219 [Branchiostoma floridae x Branchiostoma japonicum]